MPMVAHKTARFEEFLRVADRIESKYADVPEFWLAMLWAYEKLGNHPLLWARLQSIPDAVKQDRQLLRYQAMMSLYQEGLDEHVVQEGHCRFAEVFEEAIPPRRWEPKVKDANRKLRVGFASADFRHHAVGFMMRDVLEYLDRREFQVFLIKFGPVEDDVTDWFAQQGKMLRANGLSPVEVVRTIEGAKIDILIDCGGPTSDMEPGIFAFRPAPVQVAWAAYPASTGFKTIQYRLSDSFCDPDLPDVWRMEPPFETCQYFDSLGMIRARTDARMTFACFGNPLKFQPRVLKAWGSILGARPEARFLFKYGSWHHPQSRAYVLDALCRAGAREDQVEFLRGQPDMVEHLDTLNEVDLILDTAPYNGTTTLFDCLCYGVPFLTIEGVSHRSRVGTMMARVMNRPEWIAGTLEEYVDRAVHAPSVGTDDRIQLQNSFRASDLQNGPKMAEKFGEALREIWELYCHGELG